MTLEGNLCPGPPDEVEGKERRGAQRVDTAQRVRSRDRTPGFRVVDDRGEKVHRRHERPILGELEDRGIIAGGGVHEDARVLDAWQMAQDLRQVGGAELAGSAGAVRERREAEPGCLVERFDRHGRA